MPPLRWCCGRPEGLRPPPPTDRCGLLDPGRAQMRRRTERGPPSAVAVRPPVDATTDLTRPAHGSYNLGTARKAASAATNSVAGSAPAPRSLLRLWFFITPRSVSCRSGRCRLYTRHQCLTMGNVKLTTVLRCPPRPNRRRFSRRGVSRRFRSVSPEPEQFEQRVLEPLRRLFEHAQASGEIRADIPSSWLTDALVGLVVSVLSSRPLLGREETIAVVSVLFLDGARPRPVS